jgi:hypothetical protein
LTFLGYKIKGNKHGVSAHDKWKKLPRPKHFCYTSSSLGDKLIAKMVLTIRLLLKLILRESNIQRRIQLAYRLSSTILGFQNLGKYTTECAQVFWNIYKRLKPLWYKTKYVKADATTAITDTFRILYPECSRLNPIFSIQNITIFPIWKVEYQKHSFQFKSYLEQQENKLDSAVNKEIHQLLRHPVPNRTVEYNDLRISKYSAQKGKDYVTSDFLPVHNVHCHHIIPKHNGGKDKFNNLVIVSLETHKLIHTNHPKIPGHYTKKMVAKLNNLRQNVGNNRILLSNEMT